MVDDSVDPRRLSPNPAHMRRLFRAVMKWRYQNESAHGPPVRIPVSSQGRPTGLPGGFVRRLGDTLLQAKGAALLTLGCFALAGALVVDDYGVAFDESAQRALAAVTAAYMIGADDALLEHSDRTYGVAFELPLLFIELAMGLEDYRSVHLTRHILSHLFFLVGGWFCYLLAHRMGGSRLVALAAMLLFLLHPRLYAHSFFNTKDTPFLSMLMITLFLTHRAFRKDDCAAFISCGLAVGLLTNIRILGVMLFAAVLGLRLLDLIQAADGRERKRILTTAGLFTAASALILYAT